MVVNQLSITSKTKFHMLIIIHKMIITLCHNYEYEYTTLVRYDDC